MSHSTFRKEHDDRIAANRQRAIVNGSANPPLPPPRYIHVSARVGTHPVTGELLVEKPGVTFTWAKGPRTWEEAYGNVA